MSINIIPKDQQAYGDFNRGEIVENKPVSPQREAMVKPYSNIFYWANARALKESAIGLHPHQGFEIMTFVIEGEIQHYDNLNAKWLALNKGDAQLIKAGRGISHNEKFEKGGRVFQIWFDPNIKTTLSKEPSYKDYRSSVFPVYKKGDIEEKVYKGEGALIDLDAAGIEIKELAFKDNKAELELSQDSIYSIYVIEGALTIKESIVGPDDFLIVLNEPKLQVLCDKNSRVFVIKSPAQLPYKSFYQTSIK